MKCSQVNVVYDVLALNQTITATTKTRTDIFARTYMPLFSYFILVVYVILCLSFSFDLLFKDEI